MESPVTALAHSSEGKLRVQHLHNCVIYCVGSWTCWVSHFLDQCFALWKMIDNKWFIFVVYFLNGLVDVAICEYRQNRTEYLLLHHCWTLFGLPYYCWSYEILALVYLSTKNHLSLVVVFDQFAQPLHVEAVDYLSVISLFWKVLSVSIKFLGFFGQS